tara:strand:- start:2222 stop:4816 length:2595 start_codon:yes stop_codon:yes gene_type:complete
MGKVKFKPASGKGYSNIPNAQFMIAQLEKKLDKDEREADKELEQLEARDREAEAKMLEMDRNQEANLKQINMDDSIHSVKMSAMQNNMNQEVRNFEAEKTGILKKSTFEEILGFAPSLAKSATEIAQKDWQATMEGSYNYHMTHGLTEDQKIRLELIEDANWEQGKGFDILADKMQEEGFQPKEVQWMRFKNKAVDYGRLKAYSNLALKDLVPTAQQEMIRRGITDPAAQKAFMKDFEIQYLKAHNLYDPEKQKAISTDFMAEGLEAVAEQKRILFNRSENVAAFDAANKRAEGDLLPVQNNLNATVINYDLAGQSINNLFASHKRRYHKDGTPFSAQEARDAVIKDLEDVTKFKNDAHVELALRKAQGSDNFYTQQIPELLKKRAANRDAIRANEEAADKVRFDNDLKQTEKFLTPTAEDIKNKTGYDGSYASAKNAVDALLQLHPKRAADIQDHFGKYLENTPIGRQDGDAVVGHYNNLRDNYRLTTEDINAHDTPAEFKTLSMRMEVARQEKLWEMADIEKRVLPGYKKALRNALVGDDLDKGLDPSYDTALYHAESRFREEFAKTEDFQKSYDKILLEIEEGRGDFVVTAHGEKGNKDAGSYFESFSPRSQKNAKKHAQDFTTLNAEEADNAVAIVDRENHMIHNRLFLKPKQLEEISDAIYLGKPYNYPPICKRISELDPDYFGSQADVFRSQVELAERLGFLGPQYDKETGKMNRLSLPMKDFAKTWHRRTDDPFAKKFIKTLSTKDDIRKAITITERPESKAEPQFQSDFVAEHTTQTPIDPAYQFDESEYQYNIGNLKEVNALIQRSKGAVKKDEILFDGNFIRVNGDSTEYFKLKGTENGYGYWPGKGWYKFDIR